MGHASYLHRNWWHDSSDSWYRHKPYGWNSYWDTRDTFWHSTWTSHRPLYYGNGLSFSATWRSGFFGASYEASRYDPWPLSSLWTYDPWYTPAYTYAPTTVIYPERTVYVPSSGVETYTNDSWLASSYASSGYSSGSAGSWIGSGSGTQATPVVGSVAAPVATVFRAPMKDGAAGVMNWDATPARIVNSIRQGVGGGGGAAAAEFLGRTPSGAWELVYRDRTTRDGALVLVCSAVGSDAESPTVMVVMKSDPPALEAGAVIAVTGRLVEVSVDHPDFAGGLLVLDEAQASKQ